MATCVSTERMQGSNRQIKMRKKLREAAAAAAAHHRKARDKFHLFSPCNIQNTPKQIGTLTRDFKHLAVDMFLIEEEGKKVRAF